MNHLVSITISTYQFTAVFSENQENDEKRFTVFGRGGKQIANWQLHEDSNLSEMAREFLAIEFPFVDISAPL